MKNKQITPSVLTADYFIELLKQVPGKTIIKLVVEYPLEHSLETVEIEHNIDIGLIEFQIERLKENAFLEFGVIKLMAEDEFK